MDFISGELQEVNLDRVKDQAKIKNWNYKIFRLKRITYSGLQIQICKSVLIIWNTFPAFTLEKFSRLKQVGYLGIYAEIIQYISSRFSSLNY